MWIPRGSTYWLAGRGLALVKNLILRQIWLGSRRVHYHWLLLAHDVLLGDLHSLALLPLLDADRSIIQLDEIRQILDDELSVEGVLRDRIVPEPKDLELYAILEVEDLEQIRDLVLPEIQLSHILAIREELERRYLVKG